MRTLMIAFGMITLGFLLVTTNCATVAGEPKTRMEVKALRISSVENAEMESMGDQNEMTLCYQVNVENKDSMEIQNNENSLCTCPTNNHLEFPSLLNGIF